MEQSAYAVTCENIRSIPKCAQLRMLAGESGASRHIRWVHYVEEPSYIQFLKGGELVLTTGLLLRDRETFLDFISQLHSRNIAGVVINEPPTGEIPYLEDIRSLGDRLGLCIFSLPFQCRFVDLMQSITRQIFLNQQQRHDLDTMLFSLFFDAASPYQHGAEALAKHGFHPGTHRCCFVISFRGKDGAAVELRQMASQVYERLRAVRRGRKMLYLLHGNELLGMFAVKEEETAETALGCCRDVHKELSAAFPGVALFAGTGDLAVGFSSLREEMESVRAAASLAAGLGLPLLESRRCGLFRILSGVQRPELLKGLSEGVLAPLLDYDEKRGGELVKTLHRYLMNSGSLQATADELFIHYNTLRHRLRTIEELLGQDLSSYHTIFELMLAFLIRRYLDESGEINE